MKNTELKKDISTMVGLIKDLQEQIKVLETAQLTCQDCIKLRGQLKLERSNKRRLSARLDNKKNEGLIKEYQNILKLKQAEIDKLSEENFKSTCLVIAKAKTELETQSTAIETSREEHRLLKIMKEELKQKEKKLFKYQQALLALKAKHSALLEVKKHSVRVQTVNRVSSVDTEETPESPSDVSQSVTVYNSSFNEGYRTLLQKTTLETEKVKALTLQVKQLNQKNSKLRNFNNRLEEEIKDIITSNKENNKPRAPNSNESQELSALQRKVSLKDKALKKLKTEIKEFEEASTHLQEQLQQKKDQILKSWNKNKVLTRKITQMEQTATERTTSEAKLNKKLGVLQKELEKYKKRLDLLRKRLKEMKTEIKTYQQGLNPERVEAFLKNTSESFELQGKVLQLQTRVLTLEIENKKAGKKIKLLQEQHSNTTTGISPQGSTEWKVFCSNAKTLLAKEKEKNTSLEIELVGLEENKATQEILLKSHQAEQHLLRQRVQQLVSIVNSRIKPREVLQDNLDRAMTGSHPLSVLASARKLRSRKKRLESLSTVGTQATLSTKEAETIVDSVAVVSTGTIASLEDPKILEKAEELERVRRENRRLKLELELLNEKQEAHLASDLEGETRFNEVIEENKRLKKELAVFDVNFFDEIEDLKYKYAKLQHKFNSGQTS